ncbi:MAG: FAD-dependent oxidoreductase [Opitutaceae bacterium]
MTESIVIVGGGQAGVQLADSLRAAGYTDPITLFGDEDHLPYQRPPLSKDFMSEENGEVLPLRAERFFDENGVTVRRGVRIDSIDREACCVSTSDGERIAYSKLVLATGARNRTLDLEGSGQQGIHSLRTLDDAVDLRGALLSAKKAVVIGAGFIGLEFAASARKRGLDVTVIEFAGRPMARVLSVEMSAYFTRAHTAAGIDLRFGEGVVGFTGNPDGTVSGVIGSSGAEYPADLVLVGIGVVPNTELAEAAKLEVRNGIVVDGALTTSDPAIYALGDCASYPSVHMGGSARLESVQNAADHARHLAHIIAGGELADYATLPWFWSQQADRKLQIVGLAEPDDDRISRGDPDGAFAVYSFRGNTLVAVETVNSPAEHMAARRLIARGLPLTPEQVSAPGFDLKAHTATTGGA